MELNFMKKPFSYSVYFLVAYKRKQGQQVRP